MILNRLTRPRSLARRLAISAALAVGLLSATVAAPDTARQVPVAGSALAPAPAYAGNCTLPGLCGVFVNYSSVGIGLVHNWSDSPNWTRILYPGHRSTEFWSDTDGIYLGPPYCARIRFWVDSDVGGFYSYITRTYWESTGTIRSGYHKFGNYWYPYEIVSVYQC
jgi:hypothetical protein